MDRLLHPVREVGRAPIAQLTPGARVRRGPPRAQELPCTIQIEKRRPADLMRWPFSLAAAGLLLLALFSLVFPLLVYQ